MLKFDTSNYELKVIGLMKDELGGKLIKKIVGFRAKTFSYLQMMVVKIKKAKGIKKCVIKRKTLNLKIIKDCSEGTQLKNKINHLQKNKNDINSVKEGHKEFIKKNKSILKIQQRFKSENPNIFPEKFNKIALSSNDEKGIQSIGSIEIYAYGTSSKDVAGDKEGIKCKNIIK